MCALTVYVCMYIYVCTYMYTYIHTQTYLFPLGKISSHKNTGIKSKALLFFVRKMHK